MPPKKETAPTEVFVLTTPATDGFSGQIVGIYVERQSAADAAEDGMEINTFKVHYPKVAEKVVKEKTNAPKNGAEPNTKKHKIVPEGRPGSLTGFSFLFTGTLDGLDRATLEETVATYGGQITKKIDDASFVVIGVKPGPKKLEEIKQKGTKTLTQAEFFEMFGGYYQESPTKKAK